LGWGVWTFNIFVVCMLYNEPVSRIRIRYY
jgi:hypothetical protein